MFKHVYAWKVYKCNQTGSDFKKVPSKSLMSKNESCTSISKEAKSINGTS